MANRKRKPRLFTGVTLILAIFGGVTLLKTFNTNGKETDLRVKDLLPGRKLLQNDQKPENCTPRSIDQFPADFMTPEERQNGGVVFHIVLVIYIFAALAIVCDDYFVSSLEKICSVLRLQPDVAGATFMAAGSSAPELFTSVIGVFFAKSDVGLGTIVGSAVFNILFIIAMCGLFAGMVVYLTWWPLFRDSLFYLISVLTLALVIYDNEVTWYESLVMLLLYAIYIIIMYFNPKIGDFMIEKGEMLKEKCCCKSNEITVNPLGEQHNEKSPLLSGIPSVGQKYIDHGLFASNEKVGNNEGIVEVGQSGKFSNISYASHHSKASTVYTEKVGFERSGTALHLHNSGHHQRPHIDNEQEDLEQNGEEEEYESPFTFPNTIPKMIFWIVMLPVTVLLFLTIPDCRRPGCWKKTYVFTFVMSIVWIAGMSYIMVWMVTIAGDTLGIPDTVMGLTFLAAGTSVPDALASLFVARDGYGDMAVSNSIGSNIFDILICLGLPWLLQTTAVSNGAPLEIESKGLIFTVLILFGTVVFLVVAMLINGWKLNKKFGVICLMVYAVVIVFSCLYESNVFIEVNLPPCPRD